MRTLMSLIAVCLVAVGTLAADTTAAPIFQMRMVADQPGPNAAPMKLVTKNADHTVTNYFNVEKTVLLDQTALKSSRVTMDTLRHPLIEITFSKTGASQFATVTRENFGRQLGIIIDGNLCSTPFIRDPIEKGLVEISGSFTKAEAEDLVKKINTAITKKPGI